MTKASTLTGDGILIQLRENRELFADYSVRTIALFGSFSSGRQTDSSDVDLFVEFDRPTFDNFIGLLNALEAMFQRKVDILTPDGLRSIRVPEIADGIRNSLAYG